MAGPDLILTADTVLTVDANDTVAQAVAVTDGIISAVGSAADILATAGPGTEVLELSGKTVVPGFVDPHSHVGIGAPYVKHAAIHPPPVGDCRTADDVIAKMRSVAEDRALREGDWLLGWGYFPDQMSDKGEGLDKRRLDQEFPGLRTALIHVSGHGGVAGSRVLAEVGVSGSSESPEGGVIVRHPGTSEPTGELWETAWLPVITLLPPLDGDDYRAMCREYARWGWTTAQDGALHLGQVRDIQGFADEEPLPIDIMGLVLFTDFAEALQADDIPFGQWGRGGYKHQGLKLILDGSPQGRTAFMSQPYIGDGPNGEKEWLGTPVLTQQQTDDLVAAAFKGGVQVFAHTNGDGAVDRLVSAVRSARDKGLSGPGRTVAVHSQIMRRDQLNDYVELGIEPSFFTIHAYLFGDVHIKNFGQERAFGMSPMRSALDLGLRPTNHHDYPITPLPATNMLWSATTRRSVGGVVLGEGERVSAMESLRAVTTNSAYEHCEEATRGSIEVGKLGDLVVLDANPLEVESEALRDLTVERTIKRGKTVFELS